MKTEQRELTVEEKIWWHKHNQDKKVVQVMSSNPAIVDYIIAEYPDIVLKKGKANEYRIIPATHPEYRNSRFIAALNEELSKILCVTPLGKETERGNFDPEWWYDELS